MSRFRNPGGYRRKVKRNDTGVSRQSRRDVRQRTAEVDGCRFPSVCGCPQCDPDADYNEEGQ